MGLPGAAVMLAGVTPLCRAHGKERETLLGLLLLFPP